MAGQCQAAAMVAEESVRREKPEIVPELLSAAGMRRNGGRRGGRTLSSGLRNFLPALSSLLSLARGRLSGEFAHRPHKNTRQPPLAKNFTLHFHPTRDEFHEFRVGI